METVATGKPRPGWRIVAAMDRDRAVLALVTLATCMALALIGVLIVYPYVETADGTLRWAFADWILSHPSQDFPRLFLVSKPMALLMAATAKLTGTRWVFTFLQATACFLAVHVFAHLAAGGRLRPSLVFVLAVLVGLFPLNAFFFVTLTDSAWVVIGLAALFAALAVPARLTGPWPFAAIALGAAMLVCARPNSFGVLAALLIAAPFAGPWLRSRTRLAAIGTGLLAALTVPGLLAPTPRVSPIAVGMTWEMVALARTTGDPRLLAFLDRVGRGAEAVRRYDHASVYEVFGIANPPMYSDRIVDPANGPAIRAQYWQTIRDHPREFLAVKADLIAGVLGLGEPRLPPWYGFVLDYPGRAAAGGTVNAANLAFVRAVEVTSVNPLFLVQFPFVLMIFGLVFAAREFRRNQIGAVLSLAAVAYYATFVVNAQSVEYRYFAPSYVALSTIAVVTLARRALAGAHRHAAAADAGVAREG